jgi:hypothetical protein
MKHGKNLIVSNSEQSDQAEDYDAFVDKKDKKRKRLIKGAAFTALAGVASGMVAFAAVETAKGTTRIIEGRAVSEPINRTEQLNDQLDKDAYQIAHRFEQCEITYITDYHTASEGAPAGNSDKTSVAVGLRLHRSSDAEILMDKYMHDDRITWTPPALSTDTEKNGQKEGMVTDILGVSSVITVDEAAELTPQNFGAYTATIFIYPPNADSTVEKTPITFILSTVAEHGDFKAAGSVVCEGTAEFKDGSWQLSK